MRSIGQEVVATFCLGLLCMGSGCSIRVPSNPSGSPSQNEDGNNPNPDNPGNVPGPGTQSPPPIPDASGVTVTPVEIDDILFNPGMGFADFSFAWGASPLPENVHPRSTVAYFRWSWSELEPREGQYNFAMVDEVIAKAGKQGETLAFRIIGGCYADINFTCPGDLVPQWLRDKGVGMVAAQIFQPGDGGFPDHNHPEFLKHHEELIKAFGERYASRPEIDHIDIGTAGCWGEWNTACCGGNESTCTNYFPTQANQTRIIDWYFQYFPSTPLVIPVGGPVEYAAGKGGGWRGDCFGDYGMFGPEWNHMENLYPQAVSKPVVGKAWEKAPVQFEVCGVMQSWFDAGFDIDLILQKGLEWHMSVFNAKSNPVPEAWWPQVRQWLKKIGYRHVLKDLTHPREVSPGGALSLKSRWENKGVAPMYHPWPLGYQLRDSAGKKAAGWVSAAKTTGWLPGTHQVDDQVKIPDKLAAGSYTLEVALLKEDQSAPRVDLAIAGRLPDGWYPVSTLIVR